MTNWYVAKTRPQQEKRANTNLLRQGFRAWLPMMNRSRRHANRFDRIKSPVFPGYIFIELDPTAEVWAPINGTFGISYLLTSDGRPTPIPDGFVQALRASLGEDGTVVPVSDGLVEGEQVRILEGPFTHRIATLLDLSSSERVIVLLDLLGQPVRTTMSRRSVAPAQL